MQDFLVVLAAIWAVMGISAAMYDMVAKINSGALEYSNAIAFFSSMFFRGIIGSMFGPITIIFAYIEKLRRR
ncbi:MAG: hypothetical protein UR82_C0052G0004 [Candidatus Moranbacteria bacterium GW2011_GWF1_35_5]|nr:MAG: hypothetical protein UR82_C0052G0004 [Candidatus Moranbacteria bacterium GW2011_GWF1_35_5]